MHEYGPHSRGKQQHKIRLRAVEEPGMEHEGPQLREFLQELRPDIHVLDPYPVPDSQWYDFVIDQSLGGKERLPAEPLHLPCDADILAAHGMAGVGAEIRGETACLFEGCAPIENIGGFVEGRFLFHAKIPFEDSEP